MAEGILYFFIRFLANTLEPSIIAEFLLGPNTRRPFFSKTSTIPSARGLSGPIIVRSICSDKAKSESSSWLLTGMSIHSAHCSIPAFPGAQYIFFTLALFATFHAIACSLPPPPTINTFILFPPIYTFVLVPGTFTVYLLINNYNVFLNPNTIF